jgi:hypothetical protein
MLTHYKPSNRGHWVERKTLQGHPYWVWSRSMPRIDPSFISCVFYIYPSKQDAIDNSEDGATGFFYGEVSEVSQNFPHLYAVVNRHTVFRKGMEEPVLRINTKDGGYAILETKREEWIGHPDGDDIAICPIYLDTSLYEVDYFGRGFVIDDEFMETYNVGAGDEVIMVGRFRTHAGKKKNLPTVRFGNIAAMNEEPLYNPFTKLKQESYIVEMRSMSGFSGSPVLLWIPRASTRWRTLNHPEEPGKSWVTGFTHLYHGLLGINWGQIVYKEKAKDLETDRTLVIEMDSALAGVVPVSKLMELIDSEEMIEMRKKKDENTKKNDDESGVRVTSHEEEKTKNNEGITKEEFEDTLRKIARPLKKDDQEKKGT